MSPREFVDAVLTLLHRRPRVTASTAASYRACFDLGSLYAEVRADAAGAHWDVWIPGTFGNDQASSETATPREVADAIRVIARRLEAEIRS